jgi:hypothetical protein
MPPHTVGDNPYCLGLAHRPVALVEKSSALLAARTGHKRRSGRACSAEDTT